MELNDAEKFLKYIPPGSEAGVCLVGEADFVEHVVSAFVRLSEGREMGLQVRILYPNNLFCAAATDVATKCAFNIPTSRQCQHPKM